MVYLGWPAGVTIMVLSWVATLYTLWQMCSLHQVEGRRFNRYHELGQYALGESFAFHNKSVLGSSIVFPTPCHLAGSILIALCSKPFS